MNALNNVSIEDARRIRKEISAVVTEIGKSDSEEFESYKMRVIGQNVLMG